MPTFFFIQTLFVLIIRKKNGGILTISSVYLVYFETRKVLKAGVVINQPINQSIIYFQHTVTILEITTNYICNKCKSVKNIKNGELEKG